MVCLWLHSGTLQQRPAKRMRTIPPLTGGNKRTKQVGAGLWSTAVSQPVSLAELGGYRPHCKLRHCTECSPGC
jgi:hypothetical protein